MTDADRGGDNTVARVAPLPRGMIAETAAFAGVTRSYVSRIVHGRQPWRRARLSLIRLLYHAGWSPPRSTRQDVRRWLDRGGLTARDL